MRKFFLFLSVLILLGGSTWFVVSPFLVIAQQCTPGAEGDIQTVCLNMPLPGIGDKGEEQKTVNVTDIGKFVKYAFNFTYAAGAVIAVISIAIGGLQYMASGITGKSQGTDKILNAVYGLVLLLSGFLILRTINPQILSTAGDVLADIPNMPKVKPIEVKTLSQKLADQSYKDITEQNLDNTRKERKDKEDNKRKNDQQLQIEISNLSTSLTNLKTLNISIARANNDLENLIAELPVTNSDSAPFHEYYGRNMQEVKRILQEAVDNSGVGHVAGPPTVPGDTDAGWKGARIVHMDDSGYDRNVGGELQILWGDSKRQLLSRSDITWLGTLLKRRTRIYQQAITSTGTLITQKEGELKRRRTTQKK